MTKFRATIGKARKIPNGSRVLLACSGGPSSLAMVHMVKQGLQVENQHRRLRFIPLLVHLDESAVFWPNEQQVIESRDTSGKILDYLKSYQFDLYGSRIEQIFSEKNEQDLTKESFPIVVPSQINQLSRMLSALGDESNKEELIKRLRIRLLMSIAVKLNCDMIFFGSTATRLATQLIVDVAQGKGNQIHLETGFSDDRLIKPMMKPMRELTRKEVIFYNLHHKMKQFTTVDIHTKSHDKVSVGKATESFMSNLERDFPATVFSVCKISTKVRGKRTEGSKCSLCGTIRDNEDFEKDSAMAARQYSTVEKSSSSQPSEDDDDDLTTDLKLCYTCECMVKESQDRDGIHSLVRQVVSESVMKEKISDFLLDS